MAERLAKAGYRKSQGEAGGHDPWVLAVHVRLVSVPPMKYITLEEYRNAPKVPADAAALLERVARAIEHQRARNVAMGIYDGKATVDAMARLVDGNVKETVK